MNLTSSQVTLKDFDITFGHDQAMVFIAGNNVLESEEVVWETCEHLKKITDQLSCPWVFKASFDKANRSSIHSYRGLDLQASKDLFQKIKTHFKVPILTDIHTQEQAAWAADFADIIQIPAFLVRQTDLLQAACETGKVLNLKKMQMMAASEMLPVLEKCHHFGAQQVLLCERGTLFGYHNLIVDPLGVEQLRSMGAPVVFDVTHSLQTPGKSSPSKTSATGGRGAYTQALGHSIISLGIAAIFLETHPHPPSALCDGASATPLSKVEEILSSWMSLDRWVKQPKPQHQSTL